MKLRLHIVYANDGESVFDRFFLERLASEFKITFLTFNPNPKGFLKGLDADIVLIREPPLRFPKHDFVRTHVFTFLRAFLFNQYLKRLNPDLLIGNWAAGSYGLYSALSKFRPFILFVWGSDVLIYPKNPYYRSIVRLVLKEADAVVGGGKNILQTCATLGCDPRKAVAFPWFDIKSFLSNIHEGRRYRRIICEKTRWDQDDPIVISTRNHETIYDVQSLIEAIPHVVDRVSNAHFLILGTGRLTRNLKQLAKSLDVNDNVYFAGCIPYEHMADCLRASDVYVSTSLSDSCHVSLLEAMACKLPCVTTSIPANLEWIANMVNGILVPVKNPQKLSEAILLLLTDKKVARKLGNKAFEKVAEKTLWAENGRVLVQLIESLAHKSLDKKPRDLWT